MRKEMTNLEKERLDYLAKDNKALLKILKTSCEPIGKEKIVKIIDKNCREAHRIIDEYIY